MNIIDYGAGEHSELDVPDGWIATASAGWSTETVGAVTQCCDAAGAMTQCCDVSSVTMTPPGSGASASSVQRPLAAVKRKRKSTPTQRVAANIRERRRMCSLNAAFDRLRRSAINTPIGLPTANTSLYVCLY